jgi:hypothetical protein
MFSSSLGSAMRKVKPKCKQNRDDRGARSNWHVTSDTPRGTPRPSFSSSQCLAGYLWMSRSIENKSERQSRDVDNLRGVTSLADMKPCH